MDEALLGPSAASAPCIHGAVETPRTSRAATAGEQSQLVPNASIKQRQKRMPCPHFERLLSLLRERDLCLLLLWLLSSSLRLSLSLSRLSPPLSRSRSRSLCSRSLYSSACRERIRRCEARSLEPESRPARPDHAGARRERKPTVLTGGAGNPLSPSAMVTRAPVAQLLG